MLLDYLFEEPVSNSKVKHKKITIPKIVKFNNYRVQYGDSIYVIAKKFGLFPDTIVSINAIRNVFHLKNGITLKIPNINGLNYKVKKNL